MTSGEFFYLKVSNVTQRLFTEPTLGTQHLVCGDHNMTCEVPYSGPKNILPSESLFHDKHMDIWTTEIHCRNGQIAKFLRQSLAEDWGGVVSDCPWPILPCWRAKKQDGARPWSVSEPFLLKVLQLGWTENHLLKLSANTVPLHGPVS